MTLDELIEDFTTNKGHQVIMVWDRYNPQWRVSVGITYQHSGGESLWRGTAVNNNLMTALIEAEEEALGGKANTSL